MAAKRDTGARDIEALLLDLLPDDGTPVLNRVARVMLARRLEAPVDDRLYFAARDALLEKGAVGRLRGQGGQVFLARPEPATPPAPPAQLGAAWSEARLMAPLRRFLEGPFRAALDLPEASACVVQDTSVIGPAKGKWARPDFILVSAMRYKLLPGAQVDLHSFELKAEHGGSVLAIHEALAQTRFTHFGHFVWHLPSGAKNEAMLDDILTHCDEHGIGLIRMRDPDRAARDGCEIVLDPRRKPTLGSIVDGFLESRLTEDQKRSLLRVTGASG